MPSQVQLDAAPPPDPGAPRPRPYLVPRERPARVVLSARDQALADALAGLLFADLVRYPPSPR